MRASDSAGNPNKRTPVFGRKRKNDGRDWCYSKDIDKLLQKKQYLLFFLKFRKESTKTNFNLEKFQAALELQMNNMSYSSFSLSFLSVPQKVCVGVSIVAVIIIAIVVYFWYRWRKETKELENEAWKTNRMVE